MLKETERRVRSLGGVLVLLSFVFDTHLPDNLKHLLGGYLMIGLVLSFAYLFETPVCVQLRFSQTGRPAVSQKRRALHTRG